jgi:endonuclease YncB( thermonuclease family)
MEAAVSGGGAAGASTPGGVALRPARAGRPAAAADVPSCTRTSLRPEMASLLLLALLLSGAPTARDTLPFSRGKAERVRDGDTFEARVPRTTRTGAATSALLQVRLHGVDAPERDQPYGDAARAALQALVGGRDVEIVETDRDAYGRTVALVFVEGRDVGADLVRSGHAWAFRRHLGAVEGDPGYCVLEYEARAARRGLWATARPRAPWLDRELRKGKSGAHLPPESSAEDCVAHFGKAPPAARR